MRDKDLLLKILVGYQRKLARKGLNSHKLALVIQFDEQ